MNTSPKNRPSIKRWHPYLGEWVIIAPVTAGRPWSGTIVKPSEHALPPFDPGCYLCPGVIRASGQKNPQYDNVYIFDNDFPSLTSGSIESDDKTSLPGDTTARGICRVICFSPRHNVTLPLMNHMETTVVIDAISREFERLAAIPEIEHVMVFENRGSVIGVSNPHPHGQIYCTDFIPRMPLTMYKNAKSHYRAGGCIFCRVLENELADGSRIVCENDHAVAFVPSFARHTFEVHLVPRRHTPFITGLTTGERNSFAALFNEIQIRYDNLFGMPFPNITIFQNAPIGRNIDPEPNHFRVEFYPPLRSPDKLKYMAGFESGGGNIINPSLPEESAAALRNASTIHYTTQNGT
jgi:UDPglucose--hexose-1-phosphate uridylyltransferase